MFDMMVDRSDQRPLHDQVAAAIRSAIVNGEAVAGERLPPAKDFAAVLGVNRNTIFRAFHILRDEGILAFQRGRGVTVVGAPEEGLVLVKAKEFVDFAHQQGCRREDLLRIIERIA